MGVQPQQDPDSDTITVSKDGQWYIATDESTGVASQGETKVEALANLAEALELHVRSEPEGSDKELESSSAPWF